MVIIGIDASTSCSGVSIFNNKELVYYAAIKPPSTLSGEEHWRDRLVWQCKVFVEIFKKYRPDAAYMEDVPLKDGKKTIEKLACMQGLILGLCAAYGITITYLLPSDWRRELGLYDGTRQGLNRDVLKKKAIDMANDVFNLDLRWVSYGSKKNEDDIAEAILIAWSQIQSRKDR